MGRIADTEQLVKNIARLRHAERLSPAREDIASVRADLEGVVGPTVSRAMAARLLGVSQTALDRWIASGDIPVVITPSDRRQVPLHALLDLMQAVDDHANAHSEEAHPLAAVLRERRRAAERLDLRRVVSQAASAKEPGRDHRGAELRSLAYHRAVAQRLDERMVHDARRRLGRWRREGRIDPRYAEQWEAVLDSSLPRIARLIGSDSERARALRQNSPFAGTLGEHERRRVLETVS
jgi:hypothetical protein